MIFNSVTYLLFLAVVVFGYWVLPRKPRLWLLFVGSLVFYGFWRVEFIPVMLLSVITDYIVAIKMKTANPGFKKRWLLLSLCVNLGLLFVFKYFLFFYENAIGIGNYFGFEPDPFFLNIILPLGISFYTFQTISYTVDVYRGFIEPERNFVLFGCYVMFFPQLIAGPILRAVEVIPQLSERAMFHWESINEGLRRIIQGLFLKVVLADNISPLVDAGFATDAAYLSAWDVWTLAFLFGFQIYFDFSAYSHIAIGSARLMGIKFPENFNFPYFASSPRDFWRRWHISLSSWIRDYLYLPLTGAKVQDRSVGGLAGAVEGQKHLSALFITWGLMGLWHGAAWTFVLWGFYCAVIIFVYRSIKGIGLRMPHSQRSIIGWILTLTFMMLGWIAFRAGSVQTVLELWSKLVQPSQYTWLGMRENTYLVTLILFLGCVVVFGASGISANQLRERFFLKVIVETGVLALMISSVFIFLRPIKQFIYFQF